jgi:hypothetical protein
MEHMGMDKHAQISTKEGFVVFVPFTSNIIGIMTRYKI